MDDSDAQQFEKLSEELQGAAINLMNHLRSNHLRIRIKDTAPEIYITVSEGRNSSSSEAIALRAQEGVDVPARQGSSLSSLFAQLRKLLVA